jgi:predicted ATP-grasp superfamily ATP-dependent carboligase
MRLQLTGMLEVEFKRDPRDGLDKFLDLNLRAWGWHTLCIACGLDFPYAQYRHALGEVIHFSTPRYGRRWRRLITDIPAGIQEVRQGWSTPSEYLRSFLDPSVSSVLDWRDPLPALGDLVVCARRALGGGRRRSPIPAAWPSYASPAAEASLAG